MKPLRILIVDDHEVIRRGLRSLLSSRPEWEVCGEAADGRTAIERARTLQPDIILMDIGMSELNGIESTELITKKYPGIKVIALTMYDDHNRIMKMLKAGVKGYILKNTSKDELIEAIETVASGESYYTKDVMNVVMKESVQKKNDPLAVLTKREIQIIQLVVRSMTSKEIADKLSLSELTVSTHRKNAMQKLELKNTAALVKFAMDNNLTEL